MIKQQEMKCSTREIYLSILCDIIMKSLRQREGKETGEMKRGQRTCKKKKWSL